MQGILKYISFIVVILSMLSCNGNKTQESETIYDPRKDMTMERSSRDTSDLFRLSQSFLDCLKNHDIDGALNLVYDIDNGQVQSLSAERKIELERILTAFPVDSYKIDEMLLYSDSDTEIRYTVVMFQKPEGDDRPNTFKGSLSPYRIDGKWYLTIPTQKSENNFQED